LRQTRQSDIYKGNREKAEKEKEEEEKLTVKITKWKVNTVVLMGGDVK
jgi:hypothetical protein